LRKPGEAKVLGEARAQARELALLLERRIPAMHVVVKGVARGGSCVDVG